jgi:hypothetical protein
MIIRSHFRRLSLPIFAALTLAAAFASNAKASLINVQFGCTAGSACAGANASSALQTGAAVIGTAGDVWNLVSGVGGLGTTGSNVPLLDSTGAATSVQISWNSLLDWVVIPGEESGFASTSDEALMSAYLVSTSLNIITITGLDPGFTYDLYMISQVPVFGDGRQAGFTINAGPIVLTAPAVSSASTFIEGQNYEHFVAQADTLGDVTIDFFAQTGEADVNGFQLQTTPEPGTFGLGIGAILIGIGFRRRRSRI